MIKELTQFVKNIPHTVRERAMEPKPGLHILVQLDEHGNGFIVNSERYWGKKHGEMSTFLKECGARQDLAWMIGTNKCFDLPAKGIHTCSPYCFAFKRESWVGGEKYPKNGSKENILGRCDFYFQKCFDTKYNLEEPEQRSAIQFKTHLQSLLTSMLERIGGYSDLDGSDYIVIYNDVPLDKYRAFHDLYISEGLFNTAEYNIELEGEMHGTSNFFNGFNSKKPFLTHQTASFDITTRITAGEAKLLANFQAWAGKKLFPNPIPIFIDRSELTEEAINLYHRSEDLKITHREIISELWRRKEDLSNYYLLYYAGGFIQDFDFVSKFKYRLNDDDESPQNELKNWVIENVIEIKGRDQILLPSIELATVFDFEQVVIYQLFNNALIRIDSKKNEVSTRYFEDLDAKYYRPALYMLLLKYRKPVYDFIYKSMRSCIGRQQFDDICMTGVIDDVKGNNEYAIKVKLNIYFSLHQYFDRVKTKEIMPSRIEEHKATIAQLVDDASVHFTSDEAYAFGAGQLIYYLLSQSEAGDRTHAALEPFLQKTNHGHFNEALAGTLFKYKHAIRFDSRRFNTLAAEVLDYKPEKGLLELRPILLAGYFCPNILYVSKKSDSLS